MGNFSHKKEQAPKMILDNKIRDVRNDPYFKKKKEEAISFLKKNGQPFAEKKK